MPCENRFGMCKRKKDKSFSKQVLLDSWKVKNIGLKQPHRKMDILKKKKEYFS